MVHIYVVMKSNAAIENILTRVSVRSFTDQPVVSDDIETILRAGLAAPSARNMQPWHLIVITRRETLNAIADATPNAHMAKQAPLAIVVCGDLSKAASGWEQDFWIQDVSAVTENILLAAHALGLGAVWTGTYPSKERCNEMAMLMRTPAHIIPFATIVIGHAQTSPEVKDKWRAAAISYETFGNTSRQ